MLFKVLMILLVFGGLVVGLLTGFKGNRRSDNSSGPSDAELYGG